MALREVLIPWTEQPQEAVGVDWGNPLAQGLVGLWNLRDQTPVNFVTGEISVVQVASNCAVSPGQAGLGLRANNGTQKMLRLAASRQMLVGSASTQVTVAILTKLEGASERACVFDSRRAYLGNDDDGFGWDPNFVGTTRRFWHGTAGYGISERTADSRPILRVFSAGPDGFWWSEDGVVQTANSSATPAVALSGTDCPFFLGGSGADAVNSWPQIAFAIAVWRVAKPTSFATTLGGNFWQLFQPRTLRIPVSGGSGRIYYVIGPNSGWSTPTAAEVMAGQLSGGSPATASGSELSPTITTDPFTFAADATGLTAGEDYRVAYVWSDA